MAQQLQVTHNSLGQPDAILLLVGGMWVSLPIDPISKQFLPASSPTEADLMAIAQALPEFAALDLSDHSPEPSVSLPDFRGFEALIRATSLFGRAMSVADPRSLLLLIDTIRAEDLPIAMRLQDFSYFLGVTIAGLQSPLTALELTELNAILAQCHLPVVCALEGCTILQEAHG
jgi:hypothetical protein